MFARGLYSSGVGLVVIGVLCGSCLSDDGAGDDDPHPAPSAAGSASAKEGQATFEWIRGKLIPAELRDQPGIKTGDWLSAAPAASRERLTTAGGSPWSVTLTASPASLWPVQNTTLTATTNMDVGPANSSINIWDGENFVLLASCSTGTTCSVAVTRGNVDHTKFIAVVGQGAVLNVLGVTVSTVIPQALSFVDVDWHSTALWLKETASTVLLSETTTLTATTDQDIGPSPFFVEIYDVTAATRLTRCGSGTTCSVTVSNPTPTTPTTHRYRACFTVAAASFPPPNALECTADHTVSWATAAPHVLLAILPMPGGGFIATGVTTIDVGPTPYWIQIYDVNSGAQLAVCGGGSICTMTFPPGANVPTLIAFVGPFSTTLPGPPPSGGLDQSNSNTVSMAPPTSGQGAVVVPGPVIGPPGIPGGIPF